MTIVGVKYTTARNVAERAVDRIFSILGRGPAPSRSAVTPLQGGRIERFQPFLEEALRRQPCGLGDAEVRSLVYNYGSTYLEVLALFDDRSGGGEQLSRELALLRAETLYAVREEMALSLADVVLRRTELGTAGHPGQEALAFCAGVMAGELGWDAGRVGQEIQSVEAAFAWRGTV